MLPAYLTMISLVMPSESFAWEISWSGGNLQQVLRPLASAQWPPGDLLLPECCGSIHGSQKTSYRRVGPEIAMLILIKP